MFLLRRAAVPLALLASSAALWLVRPGVVENAVRSPVAWAVGLGTLLAGLGTREAARRLGAGPAVSQVLGTGLVVVLVVALLSPSFRQRTLVEELPDELTSATGSVPTVPPPTVTQTARASAAASPAAVPPTAVSRPPERRHGLRAGTVAPVATALRTTTARPTPAAVPKTSAPVSSGDVDRTGELSGIGHSARGTVHLRSASGAAYLVFDDVDIEGTVDPSVHLVLAGRRTPSGGVRLGALKAEKGTFSYRLPDSVDPTRRWSVLVWCDPYDTPIASADPR